MLFQYPANLAAVDISANPELAIRENISHLPSIKVYGGGSFLRTILTPISHKDLVQILRNPLQEQASASAVSEGVVRSTGDEGLTSKLGCLNDGPMMFCSVVWSP